MLLVRNMKIIFLYKNCSPGLTLLYVKVSDKRGTGRPRFTFAYIVYMTLEEGHVKNTRAWPESIYAEIDVSRRGQRRVWRP